MCPSESLDINSGFVNARLRAAWSWGDRPGEDKICMVALLGTGQRVGFTEIN